MKKFLFLIYIFIFFSIAEVQASNVEYFLANTQLMFHHTSIAAANRISTIQQAKKPIDSFGTKINNPILKRAEANLKYAEYIKYYSIPYFQKDVYLNEAEQIIANYIKYSKPLDIWFANRYYFTTFSEKLFYILGGLFGAMLDPINILVLIILLQIIRIKPNLNYKKGVIVSGLIGVFFNIIMQTLAFSAHELDLFKYDSLDVFIDFIAGGLFAIITYTIAYLIKEIFMSFFPLKNCMHDQELKELLLIENFVKKYCNSKDFECADLLYRLMIYRDAKFNSTQIQAFLTPEENIALIKDSIIKILKKKIFIKKLFHLKNDIEIIWYHTLNSYITGKDKELIRSLWKELERGYELAKPKYLNDSSKFFNFDNSKFYKIPEFIE